MLASRIRALGALNWARKSVTSSSTTRFYSAGKKGDDIDAELQKDLQKLNEILKENMNKSEATPTSEQSKAEEKSFMNFRQQSEKEAYQRGGRIFNWKVVTATFAIGGSCILALLYLRKVRLDEREKQRKLTMGKAKIGGEWELLNTENKLEGSKDLRGNWLLMYFGFTHCPDICPDEIEKMIKVIDILEADKVDNVRPIFISVDPARDTVARVKEYCSEFSSKLRGFTGSEEQVNKVAKTFRVYHSQGPKANNDQNDYIVDHTVIMYLIDPDGNFHDYYGQNRKAEEIANVMKMKMFKYEAQHRKGLF